MSLLSSSPLYRFISTCIQFPSGLVRSCPSNQSPSQLLKFESTRKKRRWHTTWNLSLNAPGPNKSVEARCLSQPRRLGHTRDSSDHFAEQTDWFSAVRPDASGSSVDSASLHGLCLVARVVQMQHVARPQTRAMSQTSSRLGVTYGISLGISFWIQGPPSDTSGSDACSTSLLFLST